MIFIDNEVVVDLYIGLLRDYFNSDFVTQDYRWNKDIKQTVVQILNQFSEEERKYPQIVVKSNIDKQVPVGIGDKVEDQEDPNTGKEFRVYGGDIDFNITFAVRARKLIERDRITGMLFLGLAHPIKDAVRKSSIETYPPFVSVSNSGEEALKQGESLDKVYYSILSSKIRGYWREYVDLEQLGTLEKILCDRVINTVTRNNIILDSNS